MAATFNRLLQQNLPSATRVRRSKQLLVSVFFPLSASRRLDTLPVWDGVVVYVRYYDFVPDFRAASPDRDYYRHDYP